MMSPRVFWERIRDHIADDWVSATDVMNLSGQGRASVGYGLEYGVRLGVIEFRYVGPRLKSFYRRKQDEKAA